MSIWVHKQSEVILTEKPPGLMSALYDEYVLASENKKLSDDLAIYKDWNSNLRADVESLKKANTMLNNKYLPLMAAFNAAGSENKRLSEDCCTLLTSNQDLVTENERLKEQVSVAGIYQIEIEVAALRSDNGLLKLAGEQVAATLKTADNRIAVIEAENERLKEQRDLAIDASNADTADVEVLHEELERLKEQVIRSYAQRELLESEINDVHVYLDAKVPRGNDETDEEWSIESRIGELERLRNPWIDINDDLPEYSQPVFIRGDESAGTNAGGVWWDASGIFNGEWETDKSCEITHWMPIPDIN